MDLALRVVLAGGLGLGLAGCTRSSDSPSFTTTAGTDATPPGGTDQGSEPGGFLDDCVVDIDCRSGACVSPLELGFPDPPTDTGGVTDGGSAESPGFCLQSCATVFECPQDGWTCDPFVGACVPEQFPAG